MRGSLAGTERLVRQRVNGVVDAEPEGHGGKLFGVVGVVGEFPAVADVLIEADRNHDAALRIQHSAPVRRNAILLVAGAMNYVLAGNIDALIEVVEDVEDGFFVAEFDNFRVGVDLVDAGHEGSPIALTVEVVDHHKATAVEEISQTLSVGRAEAPVAGSDGEEEGRIVDLVAFNVDDVLNGLGVDTSEPAQCVEEEAVGLVGVDAPTGVATTAIAIGTVAEATEDKFAGHARVGRVVYGILHFILVHGPFAGTG